MGLDERRRPLRAALLAALLLWGVRGSWDGENVAELVLCLALSSAGAGTSLGPNLPCGKIQRYLATSGIPHFIFPYTGPPT